MIVVLLIIHALLAVTLLGAITPARFTCLTRGECDAVPVGQPQDLLAWSTGFLECWF